ncbi:MAG: hypothetical protein KU28_10480 [Sulfurovum sp. PC08-66]|nr:MAG: hypothetical protein KU28_10480 [Sulfurovum sp. PC08-66]
MNRVMLDTDIIINLLKKDGYFVDAFLNLYNNNTTFYYNPIVVAEIYAGAFKKEHKTIEDFFNRLTNIDICKQTGIQAGLYANQYSKAFNKISLEDYMIAASAKINSMKLWTNNKKHYPMRDIEYI